MQSGRDRGASGSVLGQAQRIGHDQRHEVVGGQEAEAAPARSARSVKRLTGSAPQWALAIRARAPAASRGRRAPKGVEWSPVMTSTSGGARGSPARGRRSARAPPPWRGSRRPRRPCPCPCSGRRRSRCAASCSRSVVDLVGEGGARLEHLHADQPREAPVHRVGGDRRRAEPEHLRETRAARAAGRSRAGAPCSRGRVGEHRRASVDEAVHDRRGPLRLGSSARRERRAPSGCGSVSVSCAAEAGAPQHQHEAVLLHRLDQDLGAVDPDPPQALTRRTQVSVEIRPARRSVMRPPRPPCRSCPAPPRRPARARSRCRAPPARPARPDSAADRSRRGRGGRARCPA